MSRLAPAAAACLMEAPTRPPRVAVVGLGSVLTGDDAVGPTAVAWLEARWEMPDDVLLLDAGTPGTDLAAHIAGCRALVVVDAVAASRREAGTVCVWRRSELLDRPLAPRVNPHAPGVQETLLTLELLGQCPGEVLVVGVVAGEVELGVGMSAPVRAAVPEVVERVVAELDRLGCAPTRRLEPRAPDLWWERAMGPASPDTPPLQGRA